MGLDALPPEFFDKLNRIPKECNVYKFCDDCPLRFKCYTNKRIPKRK